MLDGRIFLHSSGEGLSVTTEQLVRDRIWEALNVVGYSARGELVAAPKKVVQLVNEIAKRWVETLKEKE